MSINWELTSQIATIVGAAVAFLAILSSFALYRNKRRDNKSATLKQVIEKNIARIQRLSAILPNNDLAHDIVESVCRSKDGLAVMQNFYSTVIAKGPTQKRAELFTQEMMLPFSAPVHGPTIESCRKELDDIEETCAPYQHSYPGLCTLLVGFALSFRHTLNQAERMVRDRALWESIFINLMNKREWTGTFEDFSRIVCRFFTGFVATKITETDRYTLLHASEMAGTACKTYLTKTPRELIKQSKEERTIFGLSESPLDFAKLDGDFVKTYLTKLLSQTEMRALEEKLAGIKPLETEEEMEEEEIQD